MEHYGETQKKEDLEVLNIKEENKLSSRLLTAKFKKLAKICHPDKGGTKEAFQTLQNAYDRLTEYVEKLQNDEDEEYNHEKLFFKTSNFPHEKKNCFVVVLDNKFSNQWEDTFKELYGVEKILETGGIQFKVKGMTLSFYNKPKKDNKTKVLIQGKDKDAIFEYVFESLPRIYKRVLELGEPKLEFEKKGRSSDNCDNKLNSIQHIKEHVDVDHPSPHRKKIQQKLISAYKCDQCESSFPSRLSLRTHINSKHRKINKIIDTEENSVKKMLMLKSNVDAMEYPSELKQEEKSHESHESKKHVSEVLDELLCSVCERAFTTERAMKDHNKEKHADNDLVEVVSLFSCNRCDFDAETTEDLQQHLELNIHNIEDKNVILQEIVVKNEGESIEKETFHCYKCEYSAHDENQIEEHGFKIHGIIKCDRCEYSAEDLNIMKKHKMKHTGRIIFTCNICEFETTRESMLMEHKESKHTNPEVKLDIECKKCEKSFPYMFHYNAHSCTPVYKYPCEKCNFIAAELSEIVEHMVDIHTGQLLQCSSCDFQVKDKETLDMHVKSVHSPDVEDSNKIMYQDKAAESKPEEVKCDQCEFVTKDIPSFINHIRTGHSEEAVACQYCGILVKNKEELLNHVYDNHAEIVLIHTMAKQINDLSVNFETFGNQFSQVFETMNAMKQELFVIRNKQSEQSTNLETNEKPTQKDIIELSTPKKEEIQRDSTSNTNENETKKETYATKVKENLNVEQDQKEEFLSKNILMVADSHSYNLDRRIFENQTDTKLDLAIAFTVDADEDAKYKTRNFLKIVPERLQKKNYDTLIIQAGTNEISNINVEFPSLNIKQWENKVQDSRTKVYQLAQKSLKDNPRLKKVIIVKSPPRFDPSTVDPSSIKAKLNKFGNTLYDSMWLKNGCPKNIEIVDQHLDCQGPLREKRFGNPGVVGHDGRPWDGIHMRGKMAVKHYTNSLVRIVTALNPQGDWNDHKTCPQTIYQRRNYYNNEDNNNTRYNYNYHLTCPQTRYQNNRNNIKGADRNPASRINYWTRQTNTQNYRSNTQQEMNSHRYNVEVSNRFSFLGN